MPSIDYQALRQTATIQQVLELLEFIRSERANDQVRGPCPIHRSQSPDSRSFCANLTRNAFQCFSCSAKGNQLDLYSQARSLPLYEATIELCQKLQIDIPTR
jgi:DNA primase